MIIFEPYTIAESEMTSTATNAYDSIFFGSAWQGEWVAGSYSNGDIVWKDRKIYESTADTNTDDPEVGILADVPTWIDRGYVNPWRMFDNYVGTNHLAITEATSPLEVIITTNAVAQVALFNVTAHSVTLEILDASDVVTWSKTYNILEDDLMISNWYEFFYTPYTPVTRDLIIDLENTIIASLSEKLKITFDSGTGNVVSCSNCFVGIPVEIGNTLWDPVVKAYNTGSTNTDSYGRTTFISGKSYKVITATVRPEDGSENYILRQLSNLQNKPVVYDFNNQDSDYDILRIYGAITSMSQILIGPNNTTVDVEIQGIIQKEEV